MWKLAKRREKKITSNFWLCHIMKSLDVDVQKKCFSFHFFSVPSGEWSRLFLFLLLCHVNIRSCSNLTRVFNVGGLEKIHVNINGDKRRLLYMLITTCFLSLVALLWLPSYSFHFQTAFMNIVVTFQTRSFSFYSCYQTYSKSTVVGGRGNLDRKYSLSG